MVKGTDFLNFFFLRIFEISRENLRTFEKNQNNLRKFEKMKFIEKTAEMRVTALRYTQHGPEFSPEGACRSDVQSRFL